jgi:hypothetical protein
MPSSAVLLYQHPHGSLEPFAMLPPAVLLQQRPHVTLRARQVDNTRVHVLVARTRRHPRGRYQGRSHGGLITKGEEEEWRELGASYLIF